MRHTRRLTDAGIPRLDDTPDTEGGDFSAEYGANRLRHASRDHAASCRRRQNNQSSQTALAGRTARPIAGLFHATYVASDQSHGSSSDSDSSRVATHGRSPENPAHLSAGQPRLPNHSGTGTLTQRSYL